MTGTRAEHGNPKTKHEQSGVPKNWNLSRT
jgi:hypothetical protein